MNCDYSKDSTNALICHRGLWILFILLDAVVKIARVWNSIWCPAYRKGSEEIALVPVGPFASDDEGLTGFGVSVWQRTFLHSSNGEGHPSFTSENPWYGRNRWIQDDVSVHWVSDEEITDVIWTDGSKSKAMTSSGENDFLEAKLSIWEKECWQLQPGMGSLGLWREPSETTQRSGSWPQTLNGCSVIGTMMGIFIATSSLFT